MELEAQRHTAALSLTQRRGRLLGQTEALPWGCLPASRAWQKLCTCSLLGYRNHGNGRRVDPSWHMSVGRAGGSQWPFPHQAAVTRQLSGEARQSGDQGETEEKEGVLFAERNL